MNNTRYFDLAEDCIGAAAEGKRLREIATEYTNEARFGETLRLHWKEEGGTVLLAGESDKPVFRMRLNYE